MPENTSWGDFLAGLLRGFILLRDVFGYVLPGAVFLLIGVHSGHFPRFEEFCRVCNVDLPKWAALLLALILSYVSGHFVAAIVFLIPDIKRLIKEGKIVEGPETELTPEEQLAADLVRYRREYPEIFIELDRRSILALFRAGLAGSVLLGLVVFYLLHPYLKFVIAVAGAVMLFNAYTGDRHVQKMRRITLKAARDESGE